MSNAARRSIEPEIGDVVGFVEASPDAPVVMINLLRYRAQAQYPDGAPPELDTSACTGREAYARYAAVALPEIARAGGRVVWQGSAQATLIGPPDEVWDEAVLVEYPSRSAFIQMVTRAEYLRGAPHRAAALEDSRLIATAPVPLDTPPGR
ncbi:MAG: DUF1330 domain-containing protein [Myxococcota bacterium]